MAGSDSTELPHQSDADVDRLIGAVDEELTRIGTSWEELERLMSQSPNIVPGSAVPSNATAFIFLGGFGEALDILKTLPAGAGAQAFLSRLRQATIARRESRSQRQQTGES